MPHVLSFYSTVLALTGQDNSKIQDLIKEVQAYQNKPSKPNEHWMVKVNGSDPIPAEVIYNKGGKLHALVLPGRADQIPFEGNDIQMLNQIKVAAIPKKKR
jgi:hypothetical protein